MTKEYSHTRFYQPAIQARPVFLAKPLQFRARPDWHQLGRAALWALAGLSMALSGALAALAVLMVL